jgi:excisionase family DNA binding protein
MTIAADLNRHAEYSGETVQRANDVLKPLGPPERLLTPREVAARLGVSERWVRDHATRRDPRIAVVRLGPLLRFKADDVEAFIADQRLDVSTRKLQWR